MSTNFNVIVAQKKVILEKHWNTLIETADKELIEK